MVRMGRTLVEGPCRRIREMLSEVRGFVSGIQEMAEIMMRSYLRS
jgi:hypothetical protein